METNEIDPLNKKINLFKSSFFLPGLLTVRVLASNEPMQTQQQHTSAPE